MTVDLTGLQFHEVPWPEFKRLMRLGETMGIPLERVGERFENDAGWIQNLADGVTGTVSVIFSKAGSSRSHHYHREDSHDLWVLSGRMEYVERPVGSAEPPGKRVIYPGEMVRTPPMIEHSTYFPVDTILISMSAKSRDHEHHEQDLVRLSSPLPND